LSFSIQLHLAFMLIVRDWNFLAVFDFGHGIAKTSSFGSYFVLTTLYIIEPVRNLVYITHSHVRIHPFHSAGGRLQRPRLGDPWLSGGPMHCDVSLSWLSILAPNTAGREPVGESVSLDVHWQLSRRRNSRSGPTRSACHVNPTVRVSESAAPQAR
jgi:hypothetical protein